jgi:phage repressor protein C with HTH and peptisase S24 domain
VPDRLANLGTIAFQVDGDSMMPALEPGDIAIIREERSPRRLTYLLEREGEFSLKMLAWSNEEGRWFQQSLNPAYPRRPLDGWALVGFLVGWYRSRGSRETMDSDLHGLRFD